LAGWTKQLSARRQSSADRFNIKTEASATIAWNYHLHSRLFEIGFAESEL
jgi:hypothetical protein